MQDLPITAKKMFNRDRQVTLDGVEFWYARDLMVILEYSRWEDFETLLRRAMSACEKSGESVKNHFREVPKMVKVGSGAQREQLDYELTRYACYLVAQNGDPRKKKSIAIAQSYFALQTRMQELGQVSSQHEERIEARTQYSQADKELSSILYEKGFDSRGIATVKSEGDRGLFTKTTAQMKKHLGIPSNKPLADFLPAITLNAKALATSLTNHQTKSGQSKSMNVKNVHVDNNKEVRDLLVKKGVKPESLPKEEDIKKVERMMAQQDKKQLKG